MGFTFVACVFLLISNCFVSSHLRFASHESDEDNGYDYMDSDEDDDEDHPFLNENYYKATPGEDTKTFKQHLEDIIRGMTEKSFDEADSNKDGRLDDVEIVFFSERKMGHTIKTSASYVVYYYDSDKDGKLDKDEVFRMVANKHEGIFQIIPEVAASHDSLGLGMRSEPIVNQNGAVIHW